MSKCECNITSTPKVDSSCTLESSVEIPLCAVCGRVVRDCFCDFLTHEIMEDGVCIQCGLDNPGNQICEWRGEPPLHIDGTPVRKTSGMNSRRNLFKTVPLQFVCNAEGENGFYRPEFELYQIIATDSYTVSPGQTVRVSTNIVVKQSLGHPVGFFSIVNQHPGYWLYKQCSSKFYVKEGVVSSHHQGVLLVSVLNKSTDIVTIRQGTSLGCLYFNRFM
jgi:hypothetical protein